NGPSRWKLIPGTGIRLLRLSSGLFLRHSSRRFACRSSSSNLVEWHVPVRLGVRTVPTRFAPLHLEIQVRRTIGLHKSPCPYRQNACPMPPGLALLSPAPTPAPPHLAAPAFRAASCEAKARRFRWLLSGRA